MSPSAPTTTEHPVLAAERARAAAVVARDVAALQPLLAPGLRYTHATGTCHDLAAYLHYIATGPSFEQVALAAEQVLDLGDAVVVSGRLLLRLQRTGEPVQQARSWVTAVWRHSGAGWQLAVFQSTKEAAA